MSQLWEKNNELVEGLDLHAEVSAGSKDHVRRRQLQAKMAVELMDIDPAQGRECLRLWKEMSNVFVKIRDLDFKQLDDYLPFRVVDAGCPYDDSPQNWRTKTDHDLQMDNESIMLLNGLQTDRSRN